MDILLNQWYSPIIGLIGLVVGIISIPLSIVLYRKGQRLKKPCWAATNTRLIEGYSSSLADLGVTYKDQKVENLSVSRIAFWNDGRDTIDITDIAKANPLRIQAQDEVEILDAKIIMENNEPSEFSVSINEDKTSAIFGFEYVDYNQGAVMQIVHTGVSSNDLAIEGDIKGSSPLKRKDHSKVRFRPKSIPARLGKSPRGRRRVAASLLIFMSILSLVVAVWMLVYFLNPEIYERTSEPNPTINVFLGILYTLFAIYFFRRGYTYLRTSVPADLALFEEDIIPSK